ncbi:MAG TPA: decarboxylating NADP(+)-dependent phosphogluconate dehydrogenase [Treponema sp.]|nr:decarboxylating NADP(+)-dependent phosphogluconate dehydrogenase [Treponema sp.]
MKADIGFIGLAVMGENLVLNMERNGYTVSVHNRTTSVLDSFLSGRGKDKNLVRAETLAQLAESLESPRKIMMMIKAGPAVDSLIESLLPHLEAGDILIDGGNSNYKDTARRVEELGTLGIHFVGSGVSGGEEGALNGPSIMPGGAKEAWPLIKDIFLKIAAKAPDGKPCCSWMGPGGAGHFVKMVHNGIEYGDMQLVSEIYWILQELMRFSPQEMHTIFAEWNKGKLDSYLIDITAQILAFQDTDGTPLIGKILDAAGQKGTGKWTGIAALNEGVPLTLIVESVFARALSSMKEDRVAAHGVFGPPLRNYTGDKKETLAALHDALYAAKIVSYAQGFELLRSASESNEWNLDYAEIAKIWRGGCIIRSVFLDSIAAAFSAEPTLANLVVSKVFSKELKAADSAWRTIVSLAIENALPVPALSAALSWFDGYRSDRLPANLLQAQRDYFGAHTYERIDSPRGEFFHTDWTGHGGSTTSRTYSV